MSISEYAWLALDTNVMFWGGGSHTLPASQHKSKCKGSWWGVCPRLTVWPSYLNCDCFRLSRWQKIYVLISPLFRGVAGLNCSVLRKHLGYGKMKKWYYASTEVYSDLINCKTVLCYFQTKWDCFIICWFSLSNHKTTFCAQIDELSVWIQLNFRRSANVQRASVCSVTSADEGRCHKVN